MYTTARSSRLVRIELVGSLVIGMLESLGTSLWLTVVTAGKRKGTLDGSFVLEEYQEFVDAGELRNKHVWSLWRVGLTHVSAVIIDEGGGLDAVSVRGVLGNDNGVEVWGGELVKFYVQGRFFNEDGKLYLAFRPLQIREL